MNILLVVPFFSGSHRAWAEGVQQYSRHKITLITLPGRHWKWRMHGAAVTCARLCREQQPRPDLIITTDMFDTAAFRGLTVDFLHDVPLLCYFHENQITYPWSIRDRERSTGRDHSYGFINFTSACAADAVCFNSRFHMRSFLDALPGFLKMFPDYRELPAVAEIAAKSTVITPGVCQLTGTRAASDGPPVVLWNHRREYDKGPDEFFSVLFDLYDEGIPFSLCVLGREYEEQPPVFYTARRWLADRIINFEPARTREEYESWLLQSHVLPVTSRQDFFGISVVEAALAGVFPLLPRRLAFPDVFPPQQFGALFYREGMLRSRLRDFLTGTFSSADTVRNFARQYTWEFCADRYDTLFERTAEKGVAGAGEN